MAHLAQRTFEPLNIAVLTISDTRTFDTDTSGQTLTDLLQTTQRFAGKTVPRPEHWGGYCLRPERLEFWQGRADRLHDRLDYRLRDGVWQRNRLAP